MAYEAWKDTGNCKQCRRAKYCHTQCTANKRRMRKILELSMRSAIGKVMIQNGARYAEEAKVMLANVRKECGEDASTEAVEAMFERCKVLAEHSRYSVAQIIGSIANMVRVTGDSTEEVLNKIEPGVQSGTLHRQ